MTSPAKLGPWGDDEWRFSSAIQLVQDGPDWLYAQWPTADGQEERGDVGRYASMVLRDAPRERAEDIAVMAFTLMQVDEWGPLTCWWDGVSNRHHSRDVLEQILNKHLGQFKLAVVETLAGGFDQDVQQELTTLGFEVVRFLPQS